jgi:hypothetical protein
MEDGMALGFLPNGKVRLINIPLLFKRGFLPYGKISRRGMEPSVKHTPSNGLLK